MALASVVLRWTAQAVAVNAVPPWTAPVAAGSAVLRWTAQAAVENAKPPIVITHAPGHMFITDIINAELNDYLEAQKHK